MSIAEIALIIAAVIAGIILLKKVASCIIRIVIFIVLVCIVAYAYFYFTGELPDIMEAASNAALQVEQAEN